MSKTFCQEISSSNFIGISMAIRSVLDDIQRLQQFDSVNLLITGESGTGKELVARAIHSGSSRAHAPFITVNCTAIPHEQAETFLFGHVTGTATDARQNCLDYFEAAHGGTLFLDAIEDLSLGLQAKLLRVLYDGCITRVGETKPKQVDVRIIAATNQQLETKVSQGTFRSDLLFRLSRFSLLLPPLREHPEDIPLLTEYFVDKLSSEMGIERPRVCREAQKWLNKYSFPGNVRELRDIMKSALVRKGNRPVILAEHVLCTGSC